MQILANLYALSTLGRRMAIARLMVSDLCRSLGGKEMRSFMLCSISCGFRI